MSSIIIHMRGESLGMRLYTLCHVLQYNVVLQYSDSCCPHCLNSPFFLVRGHFYQFGEVNSIHLVPAQRCAFVNFTTRESAEKAASGSFNKLIVKGVLSLHMYTSTVCVRLTCGPAHSLFRMPSEDPVGQVSERVCWPGKVGTGQPALCTRTA